VQWNPTEATILLSGSFDSNVALLDGRQLDKVAKVQTTASVERVEWNTHSAQNFFVSTEDGLVTYFDTRSLNKPLWTLTAHSKPSQIACNPVIPNLLATASLDKTVKLWDLEGSEPKCLETTKMNARIDFIHNLHNLDWCF
jgi:periodic tryptophan protein 1